eukprot:365431-Chlamydomonas_euryale.AAC.10
MTSGALMVGETFATNAMTLSSVVPADSARVAAPWMTGPSASGSCGVAGQCPCAMIPRLSVHLQGLGQSWGSAPPEPGVLKPCPGSVNKGTWPVWAPVVAQTQA